jgi:hypothetical protein
MEEINVLTGASYAAHEKAEVATKEMERVKGDMEMALLENASLKKEL